MSVPSVLDAGPPSAVGDLLARLRGVRANGEAWMALCPAHDDHQPSLRVWRRGEEARVHCFAGCGWRQVYDALGMAPPETAARLDGPAEFRVKDSGEVLPIITRYEYRDAEGVLRYTVGRTPPDRAGTKHFPTWHPDVMARGGWRWGLGRDHQRVHLLYRLPDVARAVRDHHRVHVPEGEKDVENLRALGFVATCNPHGAGKWRDEYAGHVVGAELAVIVPDNDEPGRKHAAQVADSLDRAGVPCVIVILPGLPEKGDVSDWIAAGGTCEALEGLVDEALSAREGAPAAVASQSPHGLEAVRRSLDEIGTDTTLDVVEGTLRRAAEAARSCDPLKRELLRETALAAAKRAGMQRPASLVDAAFCAKAELPETGEPPALLVLSDPDPWPEDVEGAALLEELAATFARFLVLPSGALEALALWTIHTYCFDSFDISPRLALHSPVKRCGKTTAFDLLEALVCRPLAASNATTAAVFRTIDKHRPTLLLDEADTYLEGNEELRGVLNSGHRKRSAAVIRTVGDDHEPRIFSTWAPVAVAKIGRLPSTLEDRSVVVLMRRRARSEVVERLNEAKLRKLGQLRRRAARWAADHLDELRTAEPTLPDLDNDRALDNWRPLLAIAEIAAHGWAERGRRAANALSGHEDTDGASVQLLADLRDLFAKTRAHRLKSEEIVQVLSTMEERPWPEWRAGKPMTAQQLARQLTPFDVAPQTIRFADSTVRGYYQEQFGDAFARYLPALPATGATCLQTGTSYGATRELAVAPEKLPFCSDVAGVAPEVREVAAGTSSDVSADFLP